MPVLVAGLDNPDQDSVGLGHSLCDSEGQKGLLLLPHSETGLVARLPLGGVLSVFG